MLAIPVLTMPMFSVGNVEREDSTSLPEIYIDNELNLDYFNQLDDYLNKNFNFRSDLITTNSTIQEKVFSTSSTQEVIVGKEGYLFFGDTLDDYTRKNVLNDDEIKRISQTIELMNSYCESKNSKFVFTIAPNKNSIYPDLMPDNYVQLEEKSNAEKLSEILDESYYLNMFDVLNENEDVIYLKRDSHWSNEGAMIGFEAILEKLGITEKNYTIESNEIKKDFMGDLEEMLYPVKAQPEEQNYYKLKSGENEITANSTPDKILINKMNTSGKGTVYVHRDSFGNALVDLFNAQFNLSLLSRAVPYNLEAATDYVVVEIVERNIPNLLENAPVMEALEVEKPKQFTQVEAHTIVEEENNLIHCYGYFDAEKVNNIYVEVNSKTYEAFPILESDMEIKESSENLKGYSLYLSNGVDINTIKDEIKIIYN